jgi:tRNA U38,U39,U40 pseudouridine synthase TruA
VRRLNTVTATRRLHVCVCVCAVMLCVCGQRTDKGSHANAHVKTLHIATEESQRAGWQIVTSLPDEASVLQRRLSTDSCYAEDPLGLRWGQLPSPRQAFDPSGFFPAI